MKIKHSFILFLLLIGNSTFSQTNKSILILGDWVEVRREQRAGYIYTIGGGLNEPSIELSFLNNGLGSFYNPQTLDPKSNFEYILLGDTILAWRSDDFIRICDIVESEKDQLILIIRLTNNRKSDELDLKCYFIRKEKYLALTKEEIDNMKAPKESDKLYLELINKRKIKNGK